MEEEINTVPILLRPKIPHYHGETVRTLMICSAIVILVAGALWNALPLSIPLTIVLVIVLAVAAGLTSPNMIGIHYVNILLAAGGIFLFGNTALTEGLNLHAIAPLANEALALIAIITLYFATKTLRGLIIFRARKHTPVVE